MQVPWTAKFQLVGILLLRKLVVAVDSSEKVNVFAITRTGIQPVPYPFLSRTSTLINPYPLPRVGVSEGLGTGWPLGTRGLPVQYTTGSDDAYLCSRSVPPRCP